MEVEVTAVIGPGRHERTEDRVTCRNGHRPRTLDTRVGRLELEIPKSEVSRICQELDRELAEFRERPLDDARYPYIWFDATYEMVRMGARIVSQAVVIAVGVRESGEKCVLGVDVGSSESQQFWLEFCRSLLARGLKGVQLVISDAHVGLKQALAQCFPGASWQRCRVPFLRDLVTALPRHEAPAVLALVRTIYAQPTGEAARAAMVQVLERLEPTVPKAARMLREAEEDILAYLSFPREHHSSISSQSAIERVNAEVDRRAKVVGIFPNPASLLRLATAVLREQHDE